MPEEPKEQARPRSFDYLNQPQMPRGWDFLGGGPGFAEMMRAFMSTQGVAPKGAPSTNNTSGYQTPVQAGGAVPGRVIGHAMGKAVDPNEYVRRLAAYQLGLGMEGGFPRYGGEFVAGLSPDQMAMLQSFLGPGGGADISTQALGDIAQQDALGRAQLLLQPSTDRSIQEFTRRTRERANIGNNLLSTTSAEAESRGIADIYGRQGEALANLIPALTEQRTRAAATLPVVFGQNFGFGDIPRQIEQQRLQANFQEFLRTDPFAGPLQAALGFNSSTGGSLPAVETGGPSGGEQAANILGSILAGWAASGFAV